MNCVIFAVKSFLYEETFINDNIINIHLIDFLYGSQRFFID